MEPIRWMVSLILLGLIWDQSLSQEDEFGLTDELFAEGCGSKPMDLVLLVDTSKNITNYYSTIRSFLSDLVEYADVDSGNTRIAFATFSTGPKLHFRLDEKSSLVDIQKAIRTAEFVPGERNTADAFDLLRRGVFFEPYGDRSDAPNVILLITSGKAERNTHRTVQEANTLKEMKANILAVGIGSETESEINKIASKPVQENAFVLNTLDEDELYVLKDLIFAQICARSESIDLVFLLHFSQSMSKENFEIIKNSIKSLLDGADVDGDNVRVGLVLYGLEGTSVFNFTTYQQNKDGLIKAIDQISYDSRSKFTNLAAGLTIVKLRQFQSSFGDRPDVPNGMILITDSNSDSDFVAGLPNAITEMQNSGVTVFTVGLNLKNEAEIYALASSPDFSYILNDIKQMPTTASRIRKRLPSLNTIVPEPEVEPEPEPTTTVAAKPDIRHSDEADILVIFHASHKMKAKDFNKKMKVFISNLFSKAKMDSGHVKVAVLNYGLKNNLIFGLNKYSTKSTTRKAIKNMKAKLRNSNAKLGDAMKYARTDIFTSGGGSRNSAGVPGGIILITDMPSSTSSVDAKEEARLLKNAGITIFTLGIGKADLAELQNIASQPTSEFHSTARSYNDLISNTDIRTRIVSGIAALQGPKFKQPTKTTTQSLTTTTVSTTRSTTTATTTAAVTKKKKIKKLSVKTNVAIVFQSSSSTSPNDFRKHLLTFMSGLLSNISQNAGELDIALVNYGKEANILQFFGENKTLSKTLNFVSRISKKSRSKQAKLGDALLFVDILFQSLPEFRLQNNHVIILTDKPFDDDPYTASTQLKLLGIRIHAIGIKDAQRTELEIVSSKPKSNYLHSVRSYTDLTTKDSMKRTIIESLVNSPSEETTTTNSMAVNGTRAGKKKNKEKVNKVADIIVVFHADPKVNKKDFKKLMLKYIVKLVKKANIAEDQVRISLLAYGKVPKMVFDLDQFQTKKSVLKAIKKTPKNFRFKKADLGKTLQFIRSRILNSVSSRPDVPRYIIVITDSTPTGKPNVLTTEVKLIKSEGVNVHVVAIGLGQDPELMQVATSPDQYYEIDNYDEMRIYKKSGKPVVRRIPELQKIKKKGKKKDKGKKGKKGKEKKGKDKKDKKSTITTPFSTFSSITDGITSFTIKTHGITRLTVSGTEESVGSNEKYFTESGTPRSKNMEIKHLSEAGRESTISGDVPTLDYDHKLQEEMTTYQYGPVIRKEDYITTDSTWYGHTAKEEHTGKGDDVRHSTSYSNTVLNTKATKSVEPSPENGEIGTDGAFPEFVTTEMYSHVEPQISDVVTERPHDADTQRTITKRPNSVSEQTTNYVNLQRQTDISDVTETFDDLRETMGKSNENIYDFEENFNTTVRYDELDNVGEIGDTLPKELTTIKEEINGVLPKESSKRFEETTGFLNVRTEDEDETSKVVKTDEQSTASEINGIVQEKLTDDLDRLTTKEVFFEEITTRSAIDLNKNIKTKFPIYESYESTPLSLDTASVVSKIVEGKIAQELNGKHEDISTNTQERFLIPVEEAEYVTNVAIIQDKDGEYRPVNEAEQDTTSVNTESSYRDSDSSTTENYQQTTPDIFSVVDQIYDAVLRNYSFETRTQIFNSLDLTTNSKMDGLSSNLTSFDACVQLAVDIAIVLDSSIYNYRAHFLEFADMLIQILTPGINAGDVRVSLNTLSDSIFTKFAFDDFNNSEDALEAVRNYNFQDRRFDIAQAIISLRDLFKKESGARQNTSDIIVMVTGTPEEEADVTNIQRQTDISQEIGIRTFVLGIGNFSDNKLQALASKPTERHFFPLAQPQALIDMPQELINHICQGLIENPVYL